MYKRVRRVFRNEKHKTNARLDLGLGESYAKEQNVSVNYKRIPNQKSDIKQKTTK